jgi:hypothetical protein
MFKTFLLLGLLTLGAVCQNTNPLQPLVSDFISNLAMFNLMDSYAQHYSSVNFSPQLLDIVDREYVYDRVIHRQPTP